MLGSALSIEILSFNYSVSYLTSDSHVTGE